MKFYNLKITIVLNILYIIHVWNDIQVRFQRSKPVVNCVEMVILKITIYIHVSKKFKDEYKNSFYISTILVPPHSSNLLTDM